MIHKSAPPTPRMSAVGLGWPDIVNVGQHLLNLLETQGQAALEIVRDVMLLVKATTSGDYLEIFRLLNQTVVDITALIQAVKDEFGI